jgi:polyhydroxyalkanoate synthase
VASATAAATSAAQEAVAAGPAAPAVAARALMQQLGGALGGLSSLQSQLAEQVLRDLPQAAKERLDAQTFSQLHRLAQARWEADLTRLAELPDDLGERLAQADTGRLGGLLQSMLKEYLADLESLKGGSLAADVQGLTQAFTKVATGTADAEARGTLDRLAEALAVKARYGAEYYADPARTPVGQSPREAVHREGKITLYRYTPPAGAPARQGDPVLIVYSVINLPYILDLVPGYSFIEHLISQGLDVYLVEWGETTPGDRTTTLDSYIDPGLRGCVQAIQKLTGKPSVSLFGHCIGGNLALMYAALFPDDVARIVTLTTPMTSAAGGVVAVWTDKDVLPVDRIVETYGHMPAKLIRYTFMALKPYYEVLKWKLFVEKLHDERALALFYPVDRWANENVDIPGEVFRKFVSEVFHAERFRQGETRINGERVDLKRITCPLLNLAATRDWIVPPESATIITDLVGSADRANVLIEGAHVGVMIDPRQKPHWTRMSDFLRGGPAVA